MQMIRRTLLSTCVAAMAAASAGAVLAQTKEVKVGYALAVNSHYGAAAQAWADAVEKGTNGAYKFKQFPASALGGERELIEGLQLGTVEAAIVSTGAISNFVPDVGVVDIPFLFRDTQHARAVLDGAFGQELLAKFSKRGLVALAWGEQGFRHLSNNKHAVNGVADLKGLKIRVTENPVHITAFRTLGASPTPMSWPEVIGALQQGTIDGQENPISVLASAKLGGPNPALAEIAADPAGAFRAERQREQPVMRLGRLLHVGEDGAAIGDDHVGDRIDLADPVHPLQRQDDGRAVLARGLATDEPGRGAAGMAVRLGGLLGGGRAVHADAA